MRVLVTGGSGFIGSHIVEYHLAKGDQVKAIDDLSTGSLKNILPFQNNPDFEFQQADILTCPDLEKSVSWADRIYHMAAVLGTFRVLAEPIDVLSVNIAGCERILRIVSEVGSKARIIIASSSSAYGNSSKSTLSETDSLLVSPQTHPLWGYAVSKIANEALANAYFQAHKLLITPIRLFNTVGPRQTGRYGMVIPRFVEQACSNAPITVYGDGNQTRSFCDVRDSVAAMASIARQNVSICEPINVGLDHEISINELANLIRERANSTSKIIHIPDNEAYGVPFHDIAQRRPNITKLKKLTGFKHQWKLEQTIDELIAIQKAISST